MDALKTNTTGARNHAFGHQALELNTTGSNNVAFGYAALEHNTTANNNIAVGYKALETNTTGFQNIGIGSFAMDALTTACCNVGVGHAALTSATTGGYNTGVGQSALGSLTTGETNSALGIQALASVTTGLNNTGCGTDAGFSVTTGSNNLLLGHDAGRSSSPSGNITIGSDTICLGDNGINDLFCADTSISSSDARDKTDINNFNVGLEWIKALRPVTYRWDKRTWYGTDEQPYGTPDGSKKRQRLHIGFLAQEMLAVEKANGYGNTKDDSLITINNCDEMSYGIKYERLVPILVNAIKELSAKVTALEAG